MSTIKILALEKHPKQITACMETKNSYQFFTIDQQDKITVLDSYEKSKYRDFDHFVNVLGKFDPFALFFQKPKNVKELKFTELDKLS